jgi:hypothetical protein
VDLRKLLQKVETACVGSPELDSEFVGTFHSAPPNVTRSIDAAVRLIETELPGWWWNCGYCELRNGASLYAPGSSRIRASFPGAKMSPQCASDSLELRLLQDPKWGPLFDSGFHYDRGGTVPLAMLVVFLEAKIALTCAGLQAPVNNVIHAGRTRGSNPNEMSTISGRRRANALPGRI